MNFAWIGRGLFALLCLAAALIRPASAQTRPQDYETAEFRRSWGLRLINAQYAYMLGVDGSGVRVGVVDGGIAPDIRELRGQVIGGYDYIIGSPTLTDPNGHGTGVASIIAGRRDGIGIHGVAPGASIVSARIADDDGYLDFDSPIFGRAWSDLMDRGVRILNNSWGSYEPSDAITLFSADRVKADMPNLLAAARQAVGRGALMIFITHNAGLNQPNVEAGLPRLFPELERGWLAVTAVDLDGSLASYANACGVAKAWCLAAPGGDYYGLEVAQPDGSYALVVGTSFAAPHVAGTAALVWQMFPYMTTDQVRQVLLGTATDIGPPGVDDIYGYGLLNAGRAVRGPGRFDWGDFHVVQPDGMSDWFNNIVGAGGLIKSGAGTLVLYGDSTYRGATRVDGGMLAIQGSIASPLRIDPGGTVAGTGTVHGEVDNAGAIVPGVLSRRGTLTLDGPYRQRPGATLVASTDPMGLRNSLAVTGTATLEGGTVTVNFLPGLYRHDVTGTVLTARAVTGRFDGIGGPEAAFLKPELSYRGDAVELTVRRLAFDDGRVADTDSRRAVGHALERGLNRFDSGMLQAAAALQRSSTTIARAGLAAMSGEVHATARTVLIEDGRFVRDAASERIRAAFGDAGASAAEVMAYGAGGIAPAPATTDRFAFWSQGFGAWGSTRSDGNAARLSRSTGGFLIGADGAVFDSWRLGLMAGYSRTSFNIRDRASSGASDNYHLGLYGGTRLAVPGGSLGLRAGLAQTWHAIETSRMVVLPGMADRLRAHYSATTFQTFGDLGYRIEAGPAAVEPFASLAYVRLGIDGFGEWGAPSALQARSQATDTVFTTLGLRASGTFSVAGTAATVRGTLGWRHALGTTVPLSAQAFSTGETFTVAGVPIARDAAVVEAGLDMAVSSAATLGLSYSGQIAGTAQQHGFKASLNVRF